MRALTRWLGELAPAVLVVAASAFARSWEGPARARHAAALAVPLATALFAAPMLLAIPLRRALAGGAILLAALAACVAGSEGGGRAVGIGAVALIAVLSLAAPLRAAGSQGLAVTIGLAAACLAMATPWLVPSDASEVPAAMLSGNPIAHAVIGVAGIDWFRGPTLYPRLGTIFFHYPPEWSAIATPFTSVLVASWIIAVVIARSSSRRRRGPS